MSVVVDLIWNVSVLLIFYSVSYVAFKIEKNSRSFLSDVRLKLWIQHPNGCILWLSPCEIHYPDVTANFSSRPLVNKPSWLPPLCSTQFSPRLYAVLSAPWGFRTINAYVLALLSSVNIHEASVLFHALCSATMLLRVSIWFIITTLTYS